MALELLIYFVAILQQMKPITDPQDRLYKLCSYQSIYIRYNKLQNFISTYKHECNLIRIWLDANNAQDCVYFILM